MQITVELSETQKGVSSLMLRSIVQQKLRAFEDEILFVLVSVFKVVSTTSNANFEVTCRIGTRSGFATGTFHGKGASAVFAVEAALGNALERLSSQP